MTDNREMLIKYLQREDLISDEKVDLIYALISQSYMNKNELLKLSGFDTTKCFDTAYPQPYADHLREEMPDFNNGCYIYDYSQPEYRHGVLVNIYNMFAKHVLNTLKCGY